MDKNVKILLREIHEKDIQKIVKDHVRDITFDETKKEVTVFVDKKHTKNLLQSVHYVRHFMGGLRKCFGERNRIVLHIDHPHHAHDREMLIPLFVHY